LYNKNIISYLYYCIICWSIVNFIVYDYHEFRYYRISIRLWFWFWWINYFLVFYLVQLNLLVGYSFSVSGFSNGIHSLSAVRIVMRRDFNMLMRFFVKKYYPAVVVLHTSVFTDVPHIYNIIIILCTSGLYWSRYRVNNENGKSCSFTILCDIYYYICLRRST